MPAPGAQLGRSHLVEENEGSDASPLCRRQHAANFKSADVARTRHDDGLKRLAGRRRFCFRFFSGLPTHKLSPFRRVNNTTIRRRRQRPKHFRREHRRRFGGEVYFSALYSISKVFDFCVGEAQVLHCPKGE